MRKPKINKDNFYLSTQGTFKFIKEFDRYKVINSYKSHCSLKSKKDLTYLLNDIDNQAKLIYKSWNNLFNTGSVYFLNEKTKTLYRLSEHWSNSNFDKINQVGAIKSCIWNLKVYKKDFKKIEGKPTKRFKYNYQLAKLKLNKLTQIQE